MDPALCRKILDEVAEEDKTARVWMVFFGEALILKDRLYPLIEYGKQRGLQDVVLNSNGNLLTEQVSVQLIQSGLDAIYIGIDAFSPEAYSRLRVGGNYERVVKNVNRLIGIKGELGVAKPEVYVKFVEMEANSHERGAFTEYWAGRGAIVKIRPMISWAGTVKAKNLVSMERYPCYWAMRSINIAWDGRVVLCAVDFDAKYCAGNVAEKSVKEIWNGPLKKLRDRHLNGEYHCLPSFCASCKDWEAASAQYYRVPD